MNKRLLLSLWFIITSFLGIVYFRSIVIAQVFFFIMLILEIGNFLKQSIIDKLNEIEKKLLE